MPRTLSQTPALAQRPRPLPTSVGLNRTPWLYAKRHGVLRNVLGPYSTPWSLSERPEPLSNV
jgi:hypothetical protein